MTSANQQLITPVPPHLRSQSFSGSGGSIADPSRKPLPRGYKLLLSWPIAQRLVLGFLTAAIIAAAVSSITGIERANTLQNQAQFYRGLVDSNTQLTKGDGFLQLMNTGLNQAITSASPSGPSPGNLSPPIPNV